MCMAETPMLELRMFHSPLAARVSNLRWGRRRKRSSSGGMRDGCMFWKEMRWRWCWVMMGLYCWGGELTSKTATRMLGAWEPNEFFDIFSTMKLMFPDFLYVRIFNNFSILYSFCFNLFDLLTQYIWSIK